MRLGEEGLLASYRSPSAEDIPALFRDPEDRWTGFAARARVLIVNTDLVDAADLARPDDPDESGDTGRIAGLDDLFDPKWKGRVGIARPLTGTTMTHAVALYELLGEEVAREFWTRVQAAGEAGDVAIVTSNGELMHARSRAASWRGAGPIRTTSMWRARTDTR